jgi:dihydroorotate dehydrogenase electron transfer subunit
LNGKGLFSAQVLENVTLSPSTHLIIAARPDSFPDAQPGQFVSIRTSGSTSPLLRRPYSICDLTDGSVTLLVKVVGQGSAALAGVQPGELLDLLGPLGGVPFMDPRGGDAVFVAGGTGLAPIVFAIRRWKREGAIGRSFLLYGAECRDEVLEGIIGDDPTEIWCSTVDGSMGHKGDVVTLCERLLDEGRLPADHLYSCGPRDMVRALVERVDGRFDAHYTSLETVMACGVGACRGCTVPIVSGGGTVMRAVCSDGTVFRAREIAWKQWKD